MDNEQARIRLLSPYVPNALIQWHQNSELGATHVISRLSGDIVLLDASGFTALTKRLSRLGKEGPEVLTLLLNRFFDEIGQVVFNHGGDILKFAGDALWAYFSGKLESGAFFKSTMDAMKKVNLQSEITSEHPLSIHIGAERGEFYLTSMGDPGSRLEIEPVGSLLEIVQRACDIAGPSEMVVGPSIANDLRESETTPTEADGFFSLRPDLANSYDRHEADDSEKLPRNIDLTFVHKYLPRDVLKRISNPGYSSALQSEHRDVAVLFANFEHNARRDFTDPVATAGELNGTLSAAFKTIQQLGGNIARIDPYPPGHKLLILFGAPVRREDDALRNMKCAAELLSLTGNTIRIRVGLAFGSLFCGDVGKANRKEYTVMGEAANMAARLMSKAPWGEVLIDEKMRNRLPKSVRTEPVTLTLKGVGDHVPAYTFTGISEGSESGKISSNIAGQAAEREALLAASHRTAEGSKQLVLVKGEAGVGKSTLITYLVNRLDLSKDNVVSCKSAMLFGRGWLGRKFLSSLFRSQTESNTASIGSFIEKEVESKWLPLLSDLVDQSIEDNAWTEDLTAELRMVKTRDLFVRIVGSLVDSPSMILIDDFDRADEFSRSLIQSLCDLSHDTPLLLVITSRSEPPGYEDCLSDINRISLCAPSEEKWWDFFGNVFEDGKREHELFERMLITSHCNPYYITEALGRFVDSGVLAPNGLSGKLELVASEIDISVPDDLAELQLSRFDSLQETDRSLLKVASVFGCGFTAESLSRIVPDIPVDELRTSLDRLRITGLLDYYSETSSFDFRHRSMRDVIYSCIPESDVRTLHGKLADLLVKDIVLCDNKLLAHHNYRARSWELALKYSLQAAIDSAKVYSLTESSELLDQCRRIVECCRSEDVDRQLVFRFYSEYVQSLVLEARWEEAYRVCRCWRRTAKQLGIIDEFLNAALETASLLWKQSKYERCRSFLEKVIQSAELNDHNNALAGAFSIMAEVERRSSKFEKAQAWCTKSIELAQQTGNRIALADAHNKMGLALWGQGKLADAAESYQKSLEFAGDGGGKYAGAQRSNNLAIIRWELGDFVGAERLMLEALQVFRDIGDKRNEAYASGNLASLYRISGKLLKAEQLFDRADLIFEKLKDAHAHHYTIGNLGDIDIVRGDLQRAEERFTTATEFAESVGDKELAAECEVRFGELAFFQSSFEDADRRLTRAIEIAEEINSSEYIIRSSIALARLRIWQRNREQAFLLIETISEKAEEAKTAIAENEAFFLLGELHRIAGELESALICYRKALMYAKSQNVFELTLKAAVRLSELEHPTDESASTTLTELAKCFAIENGTDAWKEILNSAYFSSFSAAMREVPVEDLSGVSLHPSG